MKQKFNTLKSTSSIVLGLLAIVFVVSCEEAFDFELPEAGSIADETLPEANFSYTPNAENFRIIKFTNSSTESTNYEWDFGDGVVCDTTTVDGVHGVVVCTEETTSTDKDVSFVRYDGGEGDYEVKLTALDANNESAVVIDTIAVRDVFVPITPVLVLADFETTSLTSTWRISPFTDGTNAAPQSSSDGSTNNYEGTDTGSKTRGMKFHAGGSDPAIPTSRRYGYQEVTVSPTTADRTVKYFIEYDYAIKTEATEGASITVEILDGHFEDGADALASTPIAQSVVTERKGNTDYTTVTKEFTSNESGLISIWIYADTDQDAYVDNVKIYPKP